MCGIFGIVSSIDTSCSRQDFVELAERLFLLSETRGRESAGIAVFDLAGTDRRLLKAATPASRFLKTPNFKSFVASAPLKQSTSEKQSSTAVLGHARLVTNGKEDDNHNNQPVVREGGVLVHNGILVNIEELWAQQHGALERQFEVDSEYLLARINQLFSGGIDLHEAVRQTFQEINGAASIAFVPAGGNAMCLATNNGSLYWLHDKQSGLVVFASERFMLAQLLAEARVAGKPLLAEIQWLHPNTGALIMPGDISPHLYQIGPEKFEKNGIPEVLHSVDVQFTDLSQYQPVASPTSVAMEINSKADESLLVFRADEISTLKRCSKCILPETFPFIAFDAGGVCNYCARYQPIKLEPLAEMEQLADSIRRTDGTPDCLVTFSGGRDSSYGLHLIRTKYKLNPIAYTYDWGMVTDLARRNQSRLTAQLGIEHILVSADIRRKRENIRMNVAAWLKRPHLGLVPLFMAGDKQYFYHANQLGKINNLPVIILCENPFEATDFKNGFCGIPPVGDHAYSLSFTRKLQMLLFYGIKVLKNPAYLNRSLLDTLSAFRSYYFLPKDYLNLFEYEPWDEPTVERILLDEYDWEVSADTPTTWRIGDGTASFYNYIYYTIAGFSEFEGFRSNQIREGKLTRAAALDLVARENRPRAESIRWYLDTIGLDFNSTIRRINEVKPLYC